MPSRRFSKNLFILHRDNAICLASKSAQNVFTKKCPRFNREHHKPPNSPRWTHWLLVMKRFERRIQQARNLPQFCTHKKLSTEEWNILLQVLVRNSAPVIAFTQREAWNQVLVFLSSNRLQIFQLVFDAERDSNQQFLRRLYRMSSFSLMTVRWPYAECRHTFSGIFRLGWWLRYYFKVTVT